MNTSRFIETLAADPQPRGMGMGGKFWIAIGLGALLSAVLFATLVGPRADVDEAMHSLWFDMKFVDALLLALPSALLCWRLMRPDARPGSLAVLLVAPFLLLAVAVLIEMSSVPAAQWGAKMIGSNALHCLKVIPALAIAPLAAMIFAMRSGAPAYPVLTGALAGAAAAGIAATLYASNCPDDSPLFVASWYPLATLIVVAAGAIAGDRLLRW